MAATFSIFLATRVWSIYSINVTRLILTLALIAASIAGPALANPDAPTGANILHFKPGPEWRAYWLCERRAIKMISNKDLSSQNAFLQIEALCSAQKAAFLLAQIDSVARDQRGKVAQYVDLACGTEVIADVLSIEVYRNASGGLSSAPSYWDDPNDPLNR